MNEKSISQETAQDHFPEIHYDGDYVTIKCDRQTALDYIQKIYEANKVWNRDWYLQAKVHQGTGFNGDFYDSNQKMIRMLMDVFIDDVKISFGGGGNSLTQDAMKESLELILDIEIN